MSSMSAIAWSHLLVDVLDPDAVEAGHPALVEHGVHGTTPSSSLEIGARSRSSSTPAVRAASRAFGEIGSQPPKTRSSRLASGTNSRIRGLRPSSR